MIRIILCTVIGFFSLQTSAQQTSRYQTGVDGQRYIWNEKEIFQVSQSGDTLFSWQNPAGGQITWVDATNPFRILVFSKHTTEIHFLNNKLAPITEKDYLNNHGFINPVAVCSAKDGGLWVLDEGSSRLIKTSAQFASQSDSPFLFDRNDQTTNYYLLEWKTFLIILKAGQQILVGDLYGQILKSRMTEASWIDPAKNGLILIENNERKLFNPESGQMKTLIKKP